MWASAGEREKGACQYAMGMGEATGSAVEVGGAEEEELRTFGLLLGHLGISARAVEVVANATSGREAEESGHA